MHQRLQLRLHEHDLVEHADDALPMEINPRAVFERLFGRPGTPAERAARIKRNLSILDLISKQAS